MTEQIKENVLIPLAKGGGIAAMLSAGLYLVFMALQNSQEKYHQAQTGYIESLQEQITLIRNDQKKCQDDNTVFMLTTLKDVTRVLDESNRVLKSLK